MAVEDKFDVTATNFCAVVLAATVIRWIDEQDHKRRKIAHQRDKLRHNRLALGFTIVEKSKEGGSRSAAVAISPCEGQEVTFDSERWQEQDR